MITVLGPTIANMMTGSFVIEKIFTDSRTWRSFCEQRVSAGLHDYHGVTIFYAAFLMAMIFIVDIFYCLIDPRIKYD